MPSIDGEGEREPPAGVVFLVQPGGFRHEASYSVTASAADIKTSLSEDLDIPLGK